MTGENDRDSTSSVASDPAALRAVPEGGRGASSEPSEERAKPDRPGEPPAGPIATGMTAGRSHPWRKRLLIAAAIPALAYGSLRVARSIKTAIDTVSTDDAYVNGHVTFLAARVPGQVSEVLVDDNMRVARGDVLVRLDPEPNQVQVAIKRSAVIGAEADLKAAESQVRGTLAQLRSQRWRLQLAIENVNNQVALLRARVAGLKSREATFSRARADFARAQHLIARGAIATEEFDQRKEADRVADAMANQALEEVYETRVALGLPPRPEKGELTDVPTDLNQNYSGVRQALADLIQCTAAVGLPLTSVADTPSRTLGDFARRDREGNIDRVLESLIPDAPGVKQAQARLLHARSDLDQANLNLRYCEVRAEIDGVVTRRNVNPGNNVIAGQELMAVRSITEIWIDANFKETQLSDLRIGQRVRCEVDMYGDSREYEGRITGFTMGTGQTLALLPPQNATGNYVKIVQRLPVRIELTDYDPSKLPLFVGLSVVPYVYYKESPAGPHAGSLLQRPGMAPRAPANPGVGGGRETAAPTATAPTSSVEGVGRGTSPGPRPMVPRRGPHA